MHKSRVEKKHGRLIYREPNGVILATESPEGYSVRNVNGKAMVYKGVDISHPHAPNIIQNDILQLGIPMLKTAYRSYFKSHANRRSEVFKGVHIGYSRSDALFYWYPHEPSGSTVYYSRNKFKYDVIQSYINKVF